MQSLPELAINRSRDRQMSQAAAIQSAIDLAMRPNSFPADGYRKQQNQRQQTKDGLTSKILIVTDDVESCTTFTEVLEGAGHSVKMLRSSTEVFRVLPKFIPHIVLVDMNVPGISNILTLSFIRRLSELRHTKIIVITHRSQLMESAQSIWRAEVVLAKPVSPERLLETVSSCL